MTGRTVKARAPARLRVLFPLLFGAIFACNAPAFSKPEWTEPCEPFHIAGPLYYVGSADLATYLIVTREGSILINSCLEENVPMIEASAGKLGFKFSDVKILLISHAHWDHCAGSAEIIRRTGAKYMVMEGDVPVVESGGKTDFNYGGDPGTFFPATKVDRVLHDGDVVSLGGVELVARLTPGHTKGCTTWTMTVDDGGQSRHVVIVGSPNVNEGYKLVDNPTYPEIASDYEKTFRVLKSLPCELFLGAHGSYFNMHRKLGLARAGSPAPFFDYRGYQAFVAEKEAAFQDAMASQRAAAHRRD